MICRSGVIKKRCSCGKYEAKSYRGVINTDYRNCEGSKKQIVCK